MMKHAFFEYYDDDNLLEGYYAYNDKHSGKRPTILIAHDWSGRNEFACQTANELAELGYVGVAIDMYGKGKLGTTKDEKMALMQPLFEHRHKLLQRIISGLNATKNLPQVNANQIAAIGFCFGGLCVLDLARSGANIKGVVSLHGLFVPPEPKPKAAIKAKILALHGYADPMVPPESVHAFCQEMTEARADWQMVMYGHVLHAFTNPNANDPSFGTVYNKLADQRARVAMHDFFREIFASA